MDKQALRERIWDALDATGEARFPFPPHGRIPNFADSADAAAGLTDLAAWRDATTVKANPDSPQLPVRRAALREGKMLFVAVPRLREADCFYRLDPSTVDGVDEATTIGGIAEAGEQVGPGEMDAVDLIVSGSVAVDERGSRVGKGEGYSDLEFAILREFGLVHDETTTVTTVHDLQVVDEVILTEPHDVPMDWIVTPERTIETGAPSARPAGIDWDEIDDERLAAIPVLERLCD